MQVALYTVKEERSWSIQISLDLRVDLMWWTASAKREQLTEQIWLVISGIPLGWALQCCSHMQSLDQSSMQQKAWWEHIHNFLADLYRTNLSSAAKIPYHHLNIKQMRHLLWDIQTGWTTAGEYVLSGWEEDQLPGNPDSFLWKRQLTDEAAYISKKIIGRSLLLSECTMMLHETGTPQKGWKSSIQLAYLGQHIRMLSAVHPADKQKRQTWIHQRLANRLRSSRPNASQCRRCGGTRIRYTACASCGSAACGYCEDCLTLGRSRECGLLLQAVHPDEQAAQSGCSNLPSLQDQENGHSHPVSLLFCEMSYTSQTIQQRWGLSPAQTAAAYQALLFLTSHRRACKIGATGRERFLLWAVTGAGKTEMVFPLLEHAIRTGGRAVIATPRRDVVLELAPRIARAFPDIGIAVLYGGSEERWRAAALTIATTHQLMRFHEAFELVIIDELDAFPYHNNPMLSYAAAQACREDGKFIYLSATPSAELQQEIKQGTLAHAKVPVRYHRHPLPVPRHLRIPSLTKCIHSKQIPAALRSQLYISINRGAQIFLFIPRIAWIKDAVELIRSHFPNIHIEGTSSQDPDRTDKVSLFRQQHIRLLVTTTILERGVTIPRSDVYIMDAHDKLYDSAALIQMAGRAGRSMDDPAGGVFFASSDWTLEQKRAVSQIRLMNRTAKQQGYLR
ncbi:DEAD/DEAH box helicase [Paenibacillus sp. Z6-24]